jgi:hypothetical protein
MTLFGGLGAVLVLAGVAGTRPERALLAQRAFRVMLVLVLPAWLVTRVAAQWTVSKEGLDDSDATWLGIGYIVTEVGLLLLIAATVVAWRWSRRRGEGALRVVLLGLGGVYLAALAVAWWAMSAKIGA